MRNIFSSFNGGSFQSKYYVGHSDYKLITIKNVDDNGFNTDSVSFLSNEYKDDKYLLDIGDVLLTMTGNIGRVGIVDESNCYLNQRVLKLDCESKLYLLSFFSKYKNDVISLGRGTAQKNLSLEDLYTLPVYNSLEQIKDYKKYDYIFDMLVNNRSQRKKYIEIKQLLLSKYF